MDYAERIAEIYGLTPAEAEQIEREMAEWENGKDQPDENDGVISATLEY